MSYFHATSEENFNSIISDGLIKTGVDGIIYMTKSAEDALRFIALRLMSETIVVLEIDIPDESKIEETFDHSYSFFKCKSFGYPEDISSERITNVFTYPVNTAE